MAVDSSIIENGVAPATTEETNPKTGTVTDKIDEQPQALKGSRCEIKSLAQKGDGEVQEKDIYLSSVKKPFVEYALVAKQVFNEKDKLEKTIVDINSPHLLSCLRDVVEYYPAEPLQFSKGVSFDSPFKLLNHHTDALIKWGEEVTELDAKDHVCLLLDFLENEAGDKGREAKRLNSMLLPPYITAEEEPNLT
jgi:hypothetical protein